MMKYILSKSDALTREVAGADTSTDQAMSRLDSKNLEQSWLSDFVSGMKPAEQSWLSDFVSGMKPVEQSWLSDFVNDMKPAEQSWLSDFVNDMKPLD